MKKISVVVADKYPLMLKGIVTFLSNDPSRYEVSSTFTDALSAAEYCSQYQPDIFILGEFSDGLGGIELIRWVHSMRITSKLISYMEKKPYIDATKFINAGAMGVVWKNSPPENLKRAIEHIYNNSNYFDDGLLQQSSVIRKPVPSNFLTGRERQILQLIADGQTNKHIAKILDVSNKTVETHRLNLMKKNGCS
ncbi:response regulator transcription factor [Escherichia sp. E4385]|uniref:LuxR C-terminal-related transcriptional regulator n=1 Tax=Escherichia sp. E4385 TaxID=2040639 RepID=UPI001F117C28|nr:response regulator transcription factor [Escherichia sp. E4385]